MRFDDIEVGGHYWVGPSNWREGGLNRLFPVVVVKTGRWHHMRGECGPILVESDHASKGIVVLAPQQYRSRHIWNPTETWGPNVERILRPGDVRMDDKEFLRLHRIQKADQAKHAAQRAETEEERVRVRVELLSTFPFGGFVEPTGSGITLVQDQTKVKGQYRRHSSGWGERKKDRLIFFIDVDRGDLTKEQMRLVRELQAIKNPAC